jgi:hypothetical protein
VISEEFKKQCDAIALEVIKEHSVAVEKLTASQTAEALLQAIACGDFTRLVTIDGRQTVVYVPFAHEEKHLSEIKQLRELLEKHGIPIRLEGEMA